MAFAISSEFDPASAAAGGALIALSTSLMLYLTGRVTGISGIVNGALAGAKDAEWRWAFIASFWLGGSIISRLYPKELGPITVNLWATVIAGFMVGFGTQMGSGCTSGHGVCGIPRLSRRSIIAVIAFMLSGMVTRGFIANSEYLYGLVHDGPKVQDVVPSFLFSNVLIYEAAAGLALIYAVRNVLAKKSTETMRTVVTSLVVGLLFTFGLGLSGMTNPAKIQNFLDVFTAWDPSLAFVMLSAVTINSITFPLILNRPNPVCVDCWSVPNRKDLTDRLVIGSMIFGAGWGLGGICPGPAIVGMTSGNPAFFVFCVWMGVGMRLYHWLDGSKKIPCEKKIC
eukprot:comp18708_c0_seq1/m.20447 comp18708_c0_seq1/g.20447  ORF comp18708_c0_seq1/g.20447 comp18708_c0_seq1/m.20447 type:complete len:340 (-) comp18708_c0_seq1:282-1301(-)